MLTPRDQQWLEMKFDALIERQERTEQKVDKVFDMLDGFGGKVEMLEQENLAGAETLRRYGRQLGQLAEVARVTLSD